MSGPDCRKHGAHGLCSRKVCLALFESKLIASTSNFYAGCVCLSVCSVTILTVTHQGASFDAANVHFGWRLGGPTDLYFCVFGQQIPFCQCRSCLSTEDISSPNAVAAECRKYWGPESIGVDGGECGRGVSFPPRWFVGSTPGKCPVKILHFGSF